MPGSVKEFYTSLTDEQLLNLVRNESKMLTKDALGFLQDEFILRKLDVQIITDARYGQLYKEDDLKKRLESRILDETGKSLLFYVLSEKRDGRSNEELIVDLFMKGVEEEEAIQVLNGIEGHANRLLADTNKNMLTGIFLFLAGVAMNLINKKQVTLNVVTVLAGIAILLGIVVFLYNFFENKKFSTILNNIRRENSPV